MLTLVLLIISIKQVQPASEVLVFRDIAVLIDALTRFIV